MLNKPKRGKFRRSPWSYANVVKAYDEQEVIKANIKAIVRFQNRSVIEIIRFFNDQGSTLGRQALYRTRKDKQTLWGILAIAVWSRELFVPTWLLLHPEPMQFSEILKESIRLYKRAQIDRLRQSIEKGSDLKR
jgi:hypothetical protein